MKKLYIQLGLVTVSALSVMTFSTGAEAAGLSLRSDLLTTFNQLIQAEGVAFDELALPKLDNSKLYWDGNPNSVQVYFVNEGAGYRNQLLFGANDGPLEMIFNDISSPQSIFSEADGPLSLGQGVALQQFFGPTQLSFFLRANGFNGGQNIYGSDDYRNTTVGNQPVNSDGLTHMIAYNYFDKVAQENYTIIGFEDLWGELGASGGQNEGSDRDFNDVVFAIKGLSARPPSSTTDPADIPEPSALLGLLGVVLLGSAGLQRQSSQQSSLLSNLRASH